MRAKEFDRVLGTRVSKQFIEQLKAAARLQQRPVANYVRHVLTNAVRDELSRTQEAA